MQQKLHNLEYIASEFDSPHINSLYNLSFFLKEKKYWADEYNNAWKLLPLYFRDIIYKQRMYGFLQGVNICGMSEIIMFFKAVAYMDLLPFFESDDADVFS